MRCIMLITLLATVATGQTVLFQDDFETRSTSGWTINGPWSWTQGRMGGYAPALTRNDSWWAHSASWRNFSLSVDLLLSDLGANGSCTIQVRTSATGSITLEFRPSNSTITLSGSANSSSFRESIVANGSFFYDTWMRLDVIIAQDRLSVSLDGQLEFERMLPAGVISSIISGGIWFGQSSLDSLRFDNVVVTEQPALPGCQGGVDIEMIMRSSDNGFTVDVCSSATDSLIYVVLDASAGRIPLGPFGHTQVALGPSSIFLSAPAAFLGPSVSEVVRTDDDGAWTISFPEILLWYFYGPGRTIYGEAFVISTNAPNGAFYQSNLATFTTPMP